nr:immunoglobulin heavy chain junction region [Mus musculus]MBK4184994.1 immunoglobulin heavy chain junction region [Mus musculus]MBK4184995.1 immunoglobulin heavy chain junction region [Mus musculus]
CARSGYYGSTPFAYW